MRQGEFSGTGGALGSFPGIGGEEGSSVEKVNQIILYHTAMSCGKKNTNLLLVRVHHGYRNTHGFSRTGIVGTGTVLHFGIPQHTATHTRGITGIHR